MKKNIVLIIISTVLMILMLIEYILSYGSYNSDGYRGFYLDTDYLFLFLSSVAIFILTLCNFIGNKKGISYEKNIILTSIVISGFNGCYGLFTMLKIIAKEVSNIWTNEPINITYDQISLYLSWGLIAILFSIYFILKYHEKYTIK